MSLAGSVVSEENFRKMVEHALVGILIIDREMKWRFVKSIMCWCRGRVRSAFQTLG